MRRIAAVGILMLVVSACSSVPVAHEEGPGMAAVVWDIAGVESIGGNPTAVLGSPKVIETPHGKAVEFDGAKDALVVDSHPLAGARMFSVEVIFRPDAGGEKEQCLLCLQEAGSDNRILITVHLTDDGQWFLDTFVKSGPTDQTLSAERFKHPLGRWYRAALVFNGLELWQYVDRDLEMSAPVTFAPPGKGQTSIGAQLNKVSWFKGAILKARFAPMALSIHDFMQP